MKWILMVYLGSSISTFNQQGFAVEFDDMRSCQIGYSMYAKAKPKDTLGTMSGVCVPKGSAK